ncbi:tectonin domain-containing protein [Pyxidicoccus trucidator]|uniref:tectonin domain-containing protein n=1 Tax=Pyxidicoccus trucidator TaxID=2709662 RepID=UPI0013D9E0F3|nr:tectonin domain-containing protein [Pyxidicoccus trucidator]
MRSHSKATSLAGLAIGLLLLVGAPRAEAQQQVPAVAQVPANAPPAIPPGMKVTCTQGPGTGAAATTCPVLKWYGYTYWAFSFSDNRLAMGIVAYDSAGKVVAQWEKPGARYVYAITVDATNKSVTFAGQSDAKISMTWDALFPPPVVVQVPANAPPAVPAGMKVTCTQGPGTGAAATTCPVIKWGGYTYWAFSYTDNRLAMGIVAYDATGKVVAQWEKPGSRYVYAITVDSVGRNVVFAGQSDAKITMKWSDLFPPAAPLATPRWELVAGPAGATLKQVSVGSANAIWGLDTAGFPWRWTGSAWEKKAGTVSTLSVTADGTVWATNPPDSLRVLKLDVANNKWTWNIPTGMKQVAAITATTAWGLDNSGSHFWLNGSTWEKKGCCVSQLAVGSDGVLWATNPPDANRVLRWDGTKWAYNIPAGMTFVTVGNAQNIWALNGSDQVFKWTGAAWQPIPGALRNISAAGDGTVWGLNAQGMVYKWVP